MSEVTLVPSHSSYPASIRVKSVTKRSGAALRRRPALSAYHDFICSQTEARLQFLDFTDQLSELVRKSGVCTGFVNVQTRHTTTAVLVNENEPLLQEDMKRSLERVAPNGRAYRHDDFSIRTVNMCPDEEKNGHAHCKAMFLRTSETLNIAEGKLQLGQWQRVFLLELDRGKKRTISVVVVGDGN